MRLRTLLIAATAALAMAASGYAQLSMAKADWARGPVQYLMTKDELAQWNKLKSDAEADQFMALFWARRDPTPNTPQNEFRQDFETRVAYADQHFGTARQRGSLTDRGRILILFGAPTRAMRTGGRGAINTPTTPGGTLGAAGATTGSEAEDTSTAEQQMWVYEGAVAEKSFGAPKVELRFIDRMGQGDMRLETPRVDLTSAAQRIVMSAITQPGLSAIPTYQQQPVAQPVAAAAPAAPSTSLKTAALETAVTDVKPSNKAIVSYAEFVAPTGEYYVPLEVYVPASAGLAADAADTFFGVIQDATGKRVTAFEEPATLTASKSDFFVDKSLNLPAGKYTAVVGLAKAGAPIIVTSAPLEITGLTKESVGTSPLILSNNIYELQTAAPVKTPFAFGKLKIVPKANEAFSNKDELGYFVEVHNPAIDTTTNLPKLQMKMDLVDSKGKTVAGAPLSDANALPLSGAVGPGQYAIINSIPLAQMSKPLPPGDYTLKMKIIDTISKQSYNLEQKFKISA